MYKISSSYILSVYTSHFTEVQIVTKKCVYILGLYTEGMNLEFGASRQKMKQASQKKKKDHYCIIEQRTVKRSWLQWIQEYNLMIFIHWSYSVLLSAGCSNHHRHSNGTDLWQSDGIWSSLHLGHQGHGAIMAFQEDPSLLLAMTSPANQSRRPYNE